MTLAIALVGAVTGVLGAILGIINTWRQLSKDRIRLRVTPELAIIEPVRGGKLVTRKDGPAFPESWKPALCIEVVNLSSFPVTVAEVGFDWGRKGKYRQILATDAYGDQLPKRLEPRQAVTVYAPRKLNLDTKNGRFLKAYAKTDCGQCVRGTSRAFEEHVLRLAEKD